MILRFPKPAEQTAGGLFIPQTSQQRVEIGEVVAIGDPLSEEDRKIANNLFIGDNVPVSYGAGINYYKRVPGENVVSADEWLADLRVYMIRELATKVVMEMF